MDAMIRRKLAMVARVLDFSQANPSTDPSYAAVLARLQDRTTKAEGLIDSASAPEWPPMTQQWPIGKRSGRAFRSSSVIWPG